MVKEAEDKFRPGRRTKVIDFRGRTVDLCDLARVGPDAGANRWLKWALLMAHRHRWVTWMRVGAGLLCAGAGVVLVLTRLYGWGSRNSLVGASWLHAGATILMFFAAVAAAVFASKRAVKAAGQRAVAELMKAEICPGCGYSLRGLKPEGDGCTVCPECSAAWRLG